MAVAEAELADWRRRVSELYAAVRARDDPECAHALWRPGRDALFRAHPQSPLPPGDPLARDGRAAAPDPRSHRLEAIPGPVAPARPGRTPALKAALYSRRSFQRL